MSKKTPIKERNWYPYAVALCIAVVLYVVLAHIGAIVEGIGTFLGFFSTIVLAAVMAYLVNPLARFFSEHVLKRVKKEKTRQLWSTAFAFVLVIVVIVFIVGTVVPQLVDSIASLASNLDTYMSSLTALLAQFGITELSETLEDFATSYENMLTAIASALSANIDSVVSAAGTVGSAALNTFIALLMSIYFLANKDSLKNGMLHLMRELFPGESYDNTVTFLRRCDVIISRYVVYNLIDCFIVGVANAIFMAIVGMPYIGLVSIIVAVCNLVPTFGPIVGAVLGAFILLLVNPWYALAFIIFTVVLQTLDGYVIKPRLFGGSLGVPGMWILVGIIIGGAIFGVLGILLAIPAVAIIDFIYHDYFMPWLKAKGPRARAEAKAASGEVAAESAGDGAGEVAEASASTALEASTDAEDAEGEEGEAAEAAEAETAETAETAPSEAPIKPE